MEATLTEVPEAEAEGAVTVVYEDIKQTLRVPFVNLVFRRLAGYPDYLQVAWRELTPNLRTVFFEKAADEVRSHAVEGMAKLGAGPYPQQADEVDSTLKLFHYINPKLLLAVGALQAATAGQQPRVEELSMSEKRQIQTGIPSEARPVPMVEAEQASEQVKAIYEDIKASLGLSFVNSDYRTLAQWPQYLEDAWNALKQILARAEYRSSNAELHRLAEEALLSLPFRMEVTPHALRHSGVSDRDLDEIQSWLRTCYALLPGLISNIAFLKIGLEGEDEARRSPYPVSLL